MEIQGYINAKIKKDKYIWDESSLLLSGIKNKLRQINYSTYVTGKEKLLKCKKKQISLLCISC